MGRFFGIVLIGACLAAPAAAQEQVGYEVRFRGVPVAQITLAVREAPESYALAGQVRATRLAGLFATIRFDMAAEGRLDQSGPAPLRYRDDVDTGRRQSRVEMIWTGDLPVIASQSPAPLPQAVSPDAAQGTLDPLSALWQLVRARDRAGLCNRVMQVYDGARRSQLSLGTAEGGAQEVACAGEYRRIAGFAPAEMAERQSFPFTARYTPEGDLWRLTQVEASSLLGPIRILRRD